MYVLTDGSGSRQEPRTESTRRLLAAAGARPGPVFGRMPDAQLYRALLRGDDGPFAELFEEIADSAAREGVRVLAADAAEGFNPAHHVRGSWRTRSSGVRPALASRSRTSPLPSTPHPARAREGGGAAGARRRGLRTEALRGPGVRGVRARSTARSPTGEEAFRVETLHRAEAGFDLEAIHGPVPLYERFGERRVADGVYPEVVRFRAHLQPLAARLAALAARG